MCRAVVSSYLALTGFFRVFSELDCSILVDPKLFPHFSCKRVVCWSNSLERNHPKVAHTVALHVEMPACGRTQHLVFHIAAMLVEPCFGLPLCFTDVYKGWAFLADDFVDDVDRFAVNGVVYVPTLTRLEALVGFCGRTITAHDTTTSLDMAGLQSNSSLSCLSFVGHLGPHQVLL